jgi:hypothetical protein
MKNPLPHDLDTLLVELTNERELYNATEILREDFFNAIRTGNFDFAQETFYRYRRELFGWLKKKYAVPFNPSYTGTSSKQPYRIVGTHIVDMLLEHYAESEQISDKQVQEFTSHNVYSFIKDDRKVSRRRDSIDYLLELGKEVVYAQLFGVDATNKFRQQYLARHKDEELPEQEVLQFVKTHSTCLAGLALAHAAPDGIGTSASTLERNTIMTAIDTSKPVQTITYVFGVPTKDLTEQQLFSTISNLENQIKTLETLETKPKKIVKKIEQLRADIKAIVDLVDGDE